MTTEEIIRKQSSEIVRLQARVGELEKDKERLDFLNLHCVSIRFLSPPMRDKADFRRTIDRAMLAEKEKRL